MFPRAKAMLPRAIAVGVKIACGTDAPAIPHGHNATELAALVSRGMTLVQALRAALQRAQSSGTMSRPEGVQLSPPPTVRYFRQISPAG